MIKIRQKTVTLSVSESPKIPRLNFRPFRGESDFPLMVAVIEGSKKHDQGERVVTAENLSNFFQHLDNCDPYRDMLFAEIDGLVIGFSRVQWDKESRGSYNYRSMGIILPNWRGQGIGSAMLKYNETHLREIAQHHPDEAQNFSEQVLLKMKRKRQLYSNVLAICLSATSMIWCVQWAITCPQRPCLLIWKFAQ